MAEYKKKKDSEEEARRVYRAFQETLKQGTTHGLYAFYGEERYLVEYALAELRKRIPAGTEEFNHRRLEGKTMSAQELLEAVDSVPVFSDFVLIEVEDYDLSKTTDETRKELLHILSDIPDYMCVVFVFDTVEFKLDGRVKANAELKKLFTQVEFLQQGGSDLLKWIKKHFRAEGKLIGDEAAQHLAFITGGLMTSLTGEIGKLAAYAEGEEITVRDIDAVVTPVVDAVIFDLTDAVVAGDYDKAARTLGNLFLLNEPAQRTHFMLARTLRQLLCARAVQEAGGSYRDLMRVASISSDYPAKKLMTAARRVSLEKCRRYVEYASEAAFQLNSSSRREKEIMGELLVRLATA